ncbi:MAG: hypothetical protein Q9181_002531 [Wetmoreana brouardii]
MDRAITQALSSLIPELNGPLPQELLELAVSLLAQSRNKAGSLKAEEEIARTYACANLACERLKQSLGLPKIQPRPPCPPRVYQKLYRYLDSALVVGARRTARVPRPSDSVTPTHTPPITPRKPVITTPHRPHSARKNKRKRESSISEELPAWVMPAIRALCKKLGAPAAPPHVYAGVSSILTLPPPAQQSMDDGRMDHLRRMSMEALIVAVYVLVCTRLLGVELDFKEYPAQRDEALSIISQFRKGDEPTISVEPAAVNEWLREIGQGGWNELDWFANVVEGAGLSLEDSEVKAADDSDNSNTDEDNGLAGKKRKPDWEKEEQSFLQPGLGTMMQERVDYLSEEKRADYQRWKKDILARIERMEKAPRA